MTKDNEDCKTISVPEWGHRYMGISKSAAYGAVKRGEIPAIRIGGSVRIPVSAADRMIDEACQKASEGNE